MAVGVGLDDGPNPGIGCSRTDALKIMAKCVGVDGGLNGTGHAQISLRVKGFILTPPSRAITPYRLGTYNKIFRIIHVMRAFRQ
jgi:hypothetical protein